MSDEDNFHAFEKELARVFNKIYGKNSNTVEHINILGDLLSRASEECYRRAEKLEESLSTPDNVGSDSSGDSSESFSNSRPEDPQGLEIDNNSLEKEEQITLQLVGQTTLKKNPSKSDQIPLKPTPIVQINSQAPPTLGTKTYKIIKASNSITIAPSTPNLTAPKPKGPIFLITRRKNQELPQKESEVEEPDSPESLDEDLDDSEPTGTSNSESKKRKRLGQGKCPEESCQFVTRNARDLAKHRISVHGHSDLYHCELCSQSFRYKQTYDNHILSHTGETFVCEICGLRTRSKAYLLTHQKSHGEGKKSFKCIICGDLSESKKQLLSHMVEKHPNQGATETLLNNGDLPSFICRTCGGLFRSRNTLEAHENKIHLDKSYPCPEEDCGKVFYTKFYLKTHIKTVHEREFRHWCEDCGKGYVENSQLRIHMKVHRKEKDNVCMHCGKAFYRRNRLNQHIMVNHTHERPFKCSFCSKGFVNKARVKRHELLHSGEGEFSCGYCGEIYAVKESLRLHVIGRHLKKGEDENLRKKKGGGGVRKRRVQVVDTSDSSEMTTITFLQNGNELIPEEGATEVEGETQMELIQDFRNLQNIPITLAMPITSSGLELPTTSIVNEMPQVEITTVSSCSGSSLENYSQIPVLKFHPIQTETEPQQFDIIYHSNPTDNLVTIAGENLNYHSICNILDSI